MLCPNCQADIPSNVAFCPECGTRVANPTTALLVLQDRYELTKKLGQGGMGSVYLASDRRLSTVRWAVKEMSDAAITSPLDRQQAGEAFRREAELLARLSHPNLPRVTDHFTQDGKNYLVMEFVPGETLLTFIQQAGLPRPLSQALEWARQLCDVLTYLHSQKPAVIFRDLKPANIMITPEGSLKLIDFGIARLFKPGQSKDTQAFGTMGYSAPEQYGRGQTDARSDIYSLGVLLHQLLTGYDPVSTPFRLPLASQINPQIPPQLAAVLAQATDTEPERRFPTIEAFRQALLGSGSLVQLQGAVQPVGAAQVGGPGVLQPGTQPPWVGGSQPYPVAHPAPAAPPPYASGLPPQHLSPPGSPMATPQTKTTALAQSSMWVGVFSLVLMAIGIAIAIVARLQNNQALGGMSLILGSPVLLTGPAALVLAGIALIQQTTMATLKGRKHATIGLALGMVSLPLCCVIAALMPPS